MCGSEQAAVIEKQTVLDFVILAVDEVQVKLFAANVLAEVLNRRLSTSSMRIGSHSFSKV